MSTKKTTYTVDAQTQGKQEKRRQLLDFLYKDMPEPGTWARDYAAADAAERINLGTHTRFYVTDFIDLGILEREGPEYGSSTNGMNPGRHFHYRLLMPQDEAHGLLEMFHEEEAKRIFANRSAGNSKPRKKVEVTERLVAYAEPKEEIVKEDVVEEEATITLATNDEEETRAIVGPDINGLASHVNAETLAQLRALRKDESGAIVAAARQYMGRGDKLSEMLANLERTAGELGITFDHDAALKMFTFDRDERLEHVALALPHIDSLDQRIGRLEAQVAGLTSKVADFDKMERDLRAFRRERDQRVAAQVSSSR